MSESEHTFDETEKEATGAQEIYDQQVDPSSRFYHAPTDPYYEGLNIAWGTMNVWLFYLGTQIYTDYPYKITHHPFWMQTCPKGKTVSEVSGSAPSATTMEIYSQWSTGWTLNRCLAAFPIP